MTARALVDRVASDWRLGWLALVLLAFLANLHGAALFDVDEGAFSEATREMFSRGDFLTTYLNDRLRFDKPILVYWLQAIPVAIAGPVEWAFRLPSALCASAWAYMLWSYAQERFDARAGALAAVFAVTSLGPLVIGRTATADALLQLCLTGTLLAMCRMRDDPSLGAWRAWAWMGAGMLAKGPVAVVIPMGALFLEAASRRDLGRFFRAAFDVRGWVVFAVIAVPWYAYAIAVHGQAFIDGFIMKHNVGRFSSTMLHHGGHYFYYVPALFLVLLPFSGAVARLLGLIREQWRDPLDRFLWCWFLLVFVLFSISRTQLPHYILYGCSPLFLLLARHRDRVFLAGWGPRPGAGAISVLVLGVALLGPLLFVVLPEGLAFARDRANSPYVAAMLGQAPEVLGLGYRIATAAALVLCVAIAFGRSGVAARLAGIGLVQAAVTVFLVIPALAELQQGPIKAAAGIARTIKAPVSFWETNMPSFSVYREAVTPTRTREDPPVPGELVLTRVDRREGLPPAETLYDHGGILLLRVSEKVNAN